MNPSSYKNPSETSAIQYAARNVRITAPNIEWHIQSCWPNY